MIWVVEALAQEPKPAPQNVLVADLGLHVIGIGYQRSVSPHLAVQVCSESYTPWTQNINALGLSPEQSPSDLRGFALRARAFWYPRGRAPTGFWLSPFVQAGGGRVTVDGERVTGPVGAGGVSVGGAWLFGPLHVVFGGGVQVHAASVGGVSTATFVRPYPNLDGSLGWAF